MGATIQTTTISCTKQDLRDTWILEHQHYCSMYGNSGYSGTFAEKPNIKLIDGLWDKEKAEEHGDQHADKWGDALAYVVENYPDGTCEFFIVGICAE